ncbi:MAG: hypothetical protein VCB26_08680, partial [Candidatus Hydrogenedentota bacterium]
MATESDLTILWLRTPTGELVPVPDLTLEEYQQLTLLKDQVIPREPAPDVYLFQDDIGFTGTANENEAQFKVTMNIRVRDHGDG